MIDPQKTTSCGWNFWERFFPQKKTILFNKGFPPIFSQPVTTACALRCYNEILGLGAVCMSNFCPSKPPWCFFSKTCSKQLLTGVDWMWFFFLGVPWEKGVFFVEFCFWGFPGWLWIRIDLHPLSPLVTRIGESFSASKHPTNKKSGVLSRCSSVQKPISLDPQRRKPKCEQNDESTS